QDTTAKNSGPNKTQRRPVGVDRHLGSVVPTGIGKHVPPLVRGQIGDDGAPTPGITHPQQSVGAGHSQNPGNLTSDRALDKGKQVHLVVLATLNAAKIDEYLLRRLLQSEVALGGVEYEQPVVGTDSQSLSKRVRHSSSFIGPCGPVSWPLFWQPYGPRTRKPSTLPTSTRR